MTSPFGISEFNPSLDRSSFDCGSAAKEAALTTYFRRQVKQDVDRRVATCYVAMSDDGRVAGYYTLSSATVLLSDLPEGLLKRLPRYPSVPAVLMGSLAVDQQFRGRGLGAALLADAFKRILDSGIGVYAMIVEPKDDESAAFYRHFEFIELPSSQRLFLPVETARRAMPPGSAVPSTR